jgi:hypothetical protein
MAKQKQRAAKQQKAQMQQKTQLQTLSKPQPAAQVKSQQPASNTQQPVRIRKSLGMQTRKKRNNWIFIGSVIALIIVAIGTFLFVRLQADNAQRTGEDKALSTLSSLDPQLLATIGPGGVTVNTVMHAIKDAPLLTGAHGRAQFFYVGGEACQDCAAQRWAIVAALSRFGKFERLDTIISSGGHIATFTFHSFSYSSQYIDFVGLETTDNQVTQSQFLDHMSSTQQQIYDKYGQPPYIDKDQAGKLPFINIANQQVSTMPYFSAQLLSGRSYQDILDQLKDTNSATARSILGTANFLTSAMCVATKNQPVNVCSAAPVPEIQKSLPKPAST